MASLSCSSYAQQLDGEWKGSLAAGRAELPLVVTIAKINDGNWTANIRTADYPVGSSDAAVVMLDRLNLRIVSNTGGAYEGRLSSDATFIVGIWSRRGHEMPLVLRREQAH